MSNPYTGSSINGCNSPAVGAGKDTYTADVDSAMQALDQHDHTTGKGKPIDTNALVDGCVTNAKMAADSVATSNIIDGDVTLAKLAAAVITTLLPPGMVVPFAGTGSAPSGWLLCDGSSQLRASFPALFASIGTAHGAADGSHFNLPDYRGRFLRGQDSGAGHDPDAASRTAAATGGATGDNVGTVQGQATAKNGLALTDPGHSHLVSGSNTVPSGIGDRATFNNAATVNSSTTVLTATTGITLGAGDSETRPVNAAVQYLIKT